MARRASTAAVSLAALLAVWPAQAQYAVASEGLTRSTALHGLGAQFAFGGGAQQFVQGPARALSSLGGQWEFAFAIHPPIDGARLLAFEAAYVGSAQRFGANDQAGTLWTHSAEAVVRLQPVMMSSEGVEPYGFAGVGVAWFSDPAGMGASKALDAELVRAVMTLPMGMGVQWRLGGVLFDLRTAIRARPMRGEVPSLDVWAITLRVGADL